MGITYILLYITYVCDVSVVKTARFICTRGVMWPYLDTRTVLADQFSGGELSFERVVLFLP